MSTPVHLRPAQSEISAIVQPKLSDTPVCLLMTEAETAEVLTEGKIGTLREITMASLLGLAEK